ncbi:MAG: glycogen debranching protein GlgX [Candidatus Promineifilaceae bacterium]
MNVLPGQSFPIGATVTPDGVNFCVYSRDATAIELLLFEKVTDSEPSHVIYLDSQINRTFHYWHIFIPGLEAGQIYAFRAHGAFLPNKGLRFDGTKLLLDPYGKAVAVPPTYNRKLAALPGNNAGSAMKSIVADLDTYDWEGDKALKQPFNRTIIYEMHVGGFTRHASSGLSKEKRGTYAGLIEKIPYLLSLGITAVELLPVFQFDEQEAPGGLTNYWGYNPVSFFAPHVGYCVEQEPLAALDEFRDMVKALHRAGIEVILDVVYNHTAEGDESGPTFCFRGFANNIYYILEENKAYYANYSGTGNTLNANRSVVRRMIVDSLRYWVAEMHVDGFRFDLASILSRDETGRPSGRPPILFDIETDPVLAGTKLIAEAWDAAGLYQVGQFIGDYWREWNGQFRDDVRAFVKGDAGYVPKIANRFLASPDLYEHKSREPEQSINFITCHDGFTLNDLVSYNEKHNKTNGENNRDGHNQNFSWNCGIEGPTNDPEIERLRIRQIKNMLAINLLALGVPMILMGDEVRRTQMGNNNAYCQNNPISWLDWTFLEKNAEVFRFVQKMIRIRSGLGVYKDAHDRSLGEFLHQAGVDWHGTKLNQPDWSHESRHLAFGVRGRNRQGFIILNAYWEPLTFELPAGSNGWRRVIDTYRPSPEDICDLNEAPKINSKVYLAQPRSVVMLLTQR